MNRLIIFIPLFLFMACQPSAVHKSFSDADSLVIHFKNEQAGTVTKTVQTTDKKAINRIIDFLDKKETGHIQCGFDGKMFFYSDGTRMQEVDFNMTVQGCTRFTFILENKLVSRNLNEEAVDFLNALEQGMPVYY